MPTALSNSHPTLSRTHTPPAVSPSFFFFNDTATTEIYTLSLHDALPISLFITNEIGEADDETLLRGAGQVANQTASDRKSTRLNSSHLVISYAVFCLKKKKVHAHSHRQHIKDA